ncbi:MAG: SDR family NAD(P)-dependent oxidoreductase [Patescibacteria group bacterium]
MTDDFSSRVIIVSGGTGALGQAVVRQLLERGAQAVVTFTKKEELDVLSAKLSDQQRLNLTPFNVDVTSPKAVAELTDHVINQFHRIDGLANLVGGYARDSVIDMSWEDWNAQLTLNLHSAFLMTRAVLPAMVKANYGRIVGVGSRQAIQASPNSAAYNVAKVGVMWLMESVSNEVKAHNITANTVLPSIIDTPANRHAFPDIDYSTWVRPDEIAELICYLLSDVASGTSGAKIPVYGKA